MNGKYFCDENPMLRDYGPEPLIINIDRFAKMNPDYRTALTRSLSIPSELCTKRKWTPKKLKKTD